VSRAGKCESRPCDGVSARPTVRPPGRRLERAASAAEVSSCARSCRESVGGLVPRRPLPAAHVKTRQQRTSRPAACAVPRSRGGVRSRISGPEHVPAEAPTAADRPSAIAGRQQSSPSPPARRAFARALRKTARRAGAGEKREENGVSPSAGAPASIEPPPSPERGSSRTEARVLSLA
jgi:hypothetical protein